MIPLRQEQVWGDLGRAILSKKRLQIKKQNNKNKKPSQTNPANLKVSVPLKTLQSSNQLYPQAKVILNQTLSWPKEQTYMSPLLFADIVLIINLVEDIFSN